MRETWVQSLGWEDSPGEGKGYPSLENSTDCIICRILRARILELGTKRFIVSFQLQKVSLREMCNLSQWVAFPFSWGSSQLRDQTQVSRIAGAFFSS